MMSKREILLLGDENLYKVSVPIQKENLNIAKQVIDDLHDTIVTFKEKFGFGRAIAAPQIDEAYRIVYMHLGDEQHHFINPVLEPIGDEVFKLWDDCMSFPGLEVYLERYRKVKLTYKNLNWEDCEMIFEGDLSELIQHEYDHLDGVLSVHRVIDKNGFRINKDKSGTF